MAKRKLPSILTTEEGKRLLKIPSNRYPTGLRNKSIMSLMLNCGLRVSEVIYLKPEDIDLNEGTLRIINNKKGVDRNLAIPEYTKELLKKWDKIRPPGGEYFF